MAATFEFNEDNGAATGSPAKGATRTTAVTQCNWKSTDDVATNFLTSPVPAGNNSYPKYQFGKFTGTFTQISAGLFAHTSGSLPSNTSLFGKVTSTYTTPALTALAGATDMTTPIAITSGAAVLFSTTGPENASPSSTLSAAGYSQYLVTQIQTTSSALAGTSGSITLTLRYNES